MGSQGHRRLDRGDGRAAAGRHRRHDPRLAHARARTATARAKSSSRRRSCRRWACARSRRWSPPARAAAARRAPFFQELADKIQTLPARADAACGATRYPGVETMHVAVMGCVVNGPGESKHRQHRHQPARHRRERRSRRSTSTAQKTVTLKGDRIAEEFQAIVDRLRRDDLRRRAARTPHLKPAQKSIPSRRSHERATRLADEPRRDRDCAASCRPCAA